MSELSIQPLTIFAERLRRSEVFSDLDQMPLASEFPLPEAGEARFNILTYAGSFTSVALEEELAAGQHPFSLLYARARETLEQLRLLAEKKRSVRQQER